MDLPNLKDFKYKRFGGLYSSIYEVWLKGKHIGYVYGNSYQGWKALNTLVPQKITRWCENDKFYYLNTTVPYTPDFKVSPKVKQRSLASLELLKLQGKIHDSPDYIEKISIVDQDLITCLDDIILRANQNPAAPNAKPAIQATARIISKGGTSLRKLPILIDPEIPEAKTTTGKKLKIGNLPEVLEKVFFDGE